MKFEPKRLIDEQHAASELGTALRQARAVAGGEARTEQLWQKLQKSTSLNAPLLAAPASTVTAAKTWTVLGALTLCVLGGVYMAWGTSPLAVPRAAPKATLNLSAASAPQPAAAERSEPVVVHEELNAVQNSEPSAPRHRVRREHGFVQRTVLSAGQAESEVALLTRAEQALDRSPTRALQVLQEHAQRFPSGMLVQEREILRIDAEMALGRGPAAAARARELLKRFPDSAHRHRFALLLGSQKKTEGAHKMAGQPIPTE